MRLSATQIEALQKLVNIGAGRAARILNEIVGSRIRLQIPFIKVLSSKYLAGELERYLNEEQLSVVRLCFNGKLAGKAQLIFPTDNASTLVALLAGELPETPELDPIKIGTLIEVSNIVLNSIMCSLTNLLAQQLKYSLPAYQEGKAEISLVAGDTDTKGVVVSAQARFTIEKLQIAGDIILLFEVDSVSALLAAIELTLMGIS